MKDTLVVGLNASREFVVTAAMGPPHLDVVVLSTPWLLGLVEQVSLDAVAAHLDDGETLVGAAADIRHTAPALEGEVVTVTSTVLQAGRRLRFNAQVRTERAAVGTVVLESGVIHRDRFAR